MKKFFCFLALLSCAAFAPALDIEKADIKIEIAANIALTRFDITYSGGDFDFTPAAAAFTSNTDCQAPQGPCRLQISFEEKLKNEGGNYIYALPLDFGVKIKNFTLRADAEKQITPPEVKESPFSNFNFARRGHSHSAVFKADNFKPAGSLTIAAPAEDRVKVFITRHGGDTYFFAAVPAPPGADTLQSVAYDKNKFEEVYPARPAPAGDIIIITGILNVQDAALDLHFTAAGKPLTKKRVYINKKQHSVLARGVFLQEKLAAQN